MTQGVRYSAEFKEAVVKRLMLHEITLKEASEQYQVSTWSLKEWRKQAIAKADAASGTTPAKDTPENINLPKGVNYLDAYKSVILKDVLEAVEFGKHCRTQGVTTQQVDEWAAWFKKHPNAVCTDAYDAAQQALRSEREARHCEQMARESLQRQLDRKTKALAESAEMLLLSKKAQAILAGEGN